MLALNVMMANKVKDLTEMTGLVDLEEMGRSVQEEVVCRKVKKIINFCTEHGIQVVVNQKVVGEKYIEMFRQVRILILTRLGTRGIQSVAGVADITTIVDSIDIYNFDSDEVIGVVDEVKHTTVEEKTYIHFACDKSNCVTLLVHHWNEDAIEEQKIIYKQCMEALYCILRQPFLVPGAGCLESLLIRDLSRVHGSFCAGMTTSLMRQIAARKGHIFGNGQILKSDFDPLSDDLYGHLWYNLDHCECGLVKKTDGLTWTHLQQLSSSSTNLDKRKSTLKSSSELLKAHPDASSLILDLWSVRSSIFMSAFEAAESFASMGAIINIK